MLTTIPSFPQIVLLPCKNPWASTFQQECESWIQATYVELLCNFKYYIKIYTHEVKINK